MTTPDGEAPKKKKKLPMLTRDFAIKRLSKNHGTKKMSPLAQLQEIFEEAKDPVRFVGDTMFWKYFEDIEISRIYHTNSVEYMNLKVMFWETLFYVILLVVFTLYVSVLQTRDVIDARQEQLAYWSGCDSSGACGIHDVQDVASFWHFFQGQLVDRAFTEYPTPQQKVASIELPFADNDFNLVWHPRFVGPQKANIVLGTVRVRQLRVVENLGCQVSRWYSHIYPDCYGSYSPSYVSTREYAPRFVPSYLKSTYRYSTAQQTAQVPTWIPGMTYAGDGFTFDLPWNATDSRTMIGDLWQWEWVDQATRAIIVELTVLNSNVNVIVNNKIIFEFDPTGIVKGTVVSNGARAFLLTPSTTTPEAVSVYTMQIVLVVIFFLFTCYMFWLMYKTCRNFIGEKPLQYLKKQSCMGKIGFFFHTIFYYMRYAWNLVDLLMIGLFFTHIFLRVTTYSSISSQPNLAPGVIGHPELYMPFSAGMGPLVFANNILSIIALLVWVKLFKYLCMSSYFRLLVRILERCALQLVIFSVLLVIIFFGFAVAFFVGWGGSEEYYSTLPKSFLVGFFLLIDGYDVNEAWFEPGRDWIMPLVFFSYIALIYFVLMNIAIAIVLDVYAIADKTFTEDPNRENPMLVFLYTYYKMVLGISLVHNEAEENMRSEDLWIQMRDLPGVVRRKWIEKKRNMQAIADQSFAGMDIFHVDEMDDQQGGKTHSDWMLPSSRFDVFQAMDDGGAARAVALYDVPQSMMMNEKVSRSQLQRLMDDDETLPILLQEERAENVIRKFKAQAAEAAGTLDDADSTGGVPPVTHLQGQVFGELDNIERIKLDDEIPMVPEIQSLTGEISDAITNVRNQFRIQLTGIIEATATLFEHLVELTQGIDAVRRNHEQVMDLANNRNGGELTQGMNFMQKLGN